MFWEEYLGIVPPAAASGAEREEGGGGGSHARVLCGDGQLDYEGILDRFLYFKPPPPPDGDEAWGNNGGAKSLLPGGLASAQRDASAPHVSSSSYDMQRDASAPPLVLVGPAGCGKTALLRRWCAHVALRTSPTVTKVLSYFGNNSLDPQPATALYHIMSEMKARRMLASSDHVRLAAPAFASALIAAGGVGAAATREGELDLTSVGVLHGRSLPVDEEDGLRVFREWCR
jgi:hypothetical protein